MKRFPRSLQSRIIMGLYADQRRDDRVLSALCCMSGYPRVVLNDSIQSSNMAVFKSGNLVGMYIERLKVLSTLLANNPQTIKTLVFSNEKRGEGRSYNSFDTVLSLIPILNPLSSLARTDTCCPMKVN